MVLSILVLFNGVFPVHEFTAHIGGVFYPKCAVVVLMLYAIWTVFFYAWYRTRIVISTIILVLSVSCAIAMLFHRNLSQTADSCASSFVSHSRSRKIIPAFSSSTTVLATNIFLTAISAFRLQGYNELDNISAEQVELFWDSCSRLLRAIFDTPTPYQLMFRTIGASSDRGDPSSFRSHYTIAVRVYSGLAGNVQLGLEETKWEWRNVGVMTMTA